MKKLILVIIALSVFGITTSSVLAATIRLDPALPVMVGTEQTFDVWVEGSADNPTTDPHILLVMTDACYDSGLAIVTVDGATIAGWEDETEHTEGIKVPHTGVEDGTGYTVASLMDHLGTTETIWWALAPLAIGEITDIPKQFTVTLESSAPRMLVYVLGKTGGSEDFNNRVPPTNPGFMIPEPATIVAVALSLIALTAYAAHKKKLLV
jgi:hypothetical protein